MNEKITANIEKSFNYSETYLRPVIYPISASQLPDLKIMTNVGIPDPYH